MIAATDRAKLAPAIAPIESTGRERDDISLLVADGHRTFDTRFHRLGEHLDPGDVLVVNTSATEPAALTGRLDESTIDVHVSGPAPAGGWIVELRERDRSGPITTADRCDRISFVDGSLTLLDPVESTPEGVRLWEAEWRGTRDLTTEIRRHGRPIRYSYVPHAWPLDSYRTAFEVRRRHFSSAEMPSAARPFTSRLIDDLRRRGVEIVAVTLHTGVSSLESHERPRPERLEVEAAAAAQINGAVARGSRVIAVGTTSARAVESATVRGSVVPMSGWTDLVLSRDRPTSTITGLVTGWHPPEASHLDLLEAFAGTEIVSGAYRVAHELGYRSHEFGDSCLILRDD